MESIYETTDWRRLVAFALEQRGLHQRDLAQQIDRSTAWVSQVLSGLRAFDPAFVEPISRFLRLDPEETAYFAALVDLESPSARARQSAWATVRGRQRHRAEQGISRVFTETAGRWTFPVVVELAACEGFQPDARWIAGTLLPAIPVAEAQEALNTALATGVLVEDAEGHLVASEPPVDWTPSDVAGDAAHAAVDRLRAALELAAGCLDRARYNERHVSTTTLAVSEDQFERIRARLREVEREIVVIASERTEPANRVYQLGIQLFPVSRYTDSTDDHWIVAINQGEPPDIDPDTTE